MQYKRLLSLNRNCQFYPGKERIYLIKAKAKSKVNYDTFNYNNFLCNFIGKHIEEISDLLNKIYVNEREYKAYLANTLRFTATPNEIINRYNISYDDFHQMERIMCREILRERPTLGIKFICEVTYITPKGKNVYKKREEFIAPEIWNLWQQVIAYKDSEYDCLKSKERAKMTQSLRYDILKRDGFRCQICGRTATDGITLEVDHIVPISRGGKTVAENLRTLCKECNRGKSDKNE